MLALVLAASLLPPVDGAVLQPFAGGPDPFAAGLRRGVLFAAAEGEGVRAPCAGVVRFAGATPRGPAVTLLCGERRVTVLPVRGAVAAGAAVRRGERFGVAGGDVRLSVREPDGAYVEPRFTAGLGPAPPPVRLPPPRTLSRPREPPAPGVPVPPLPWPAWAGAALLLAGGVRLRVRAVARGRLEPARPPRAA